MVTGGGWATDSGRRGPAGGWRAAGAAKTNTVSTTSPLVSRIVPPSEEASVAQSSLNGAERLPSPIRMAWGRSVRPSFVNICEGCMLAIQHSCSRMCENGAPQAHGFKGVLAGSCWEGPEEVKEATFSTLDGGKLTGSLSLSLCAPCRLVAALRYFAKSPKVSALTVKSYVRSPGWGRKKCDLEL